MRESLRNYLESMATDFKVNGFLIKGRKKKNKSNDLMRRPLKRVNQQVRQPLREDMSF